MLAGDLGTSGTATGGSGTQVLAAALASPSVSAVRPANGTTGVRRDAFIACDLSLPNGGLDPTTLNGSVTVVRVSDGAVVPGTSGTSGGGDSIVFQPHVYLDPNTLYQFNVTVGVKDVTGTSMTPFSSTFTTGTVGGPAASAINFTKVEQAAAQAKEYTSVVIGPDGKLYAGTLDGVIQRFDVGADGTLSNKQSISTVNTANGGARSIIGLVFAPSSTSSNLVLFVTHTQQAETNGTNWTGKISRLSGANLGTYQDYVTNLPRSVRDHLTNQATFGPDGALYVSQGANTAMGAADLSWGNRNENRLSAAILRLDVNAIATRITNGQGALNAKTTEAGGTYNPYAPGAPLTLYATGVRNGYDLVWHSNGKLYTAVNGSAAGGNTPASNTTSGARPPSGGLYSGPVIPGLTNVRETEHDWLFNVQQGKYYGHPNPSRGEFAFNGGNPTSGVDPQEIASYPVGVKPDVNWAPAAYDFGQSYSPNGMIEYKSDTFGGALKGKLLVVRYSGGDDIIALTPNLSGGIDASQTIAGIGGQAAFTDPVDLIEYRNPANASDPRNGMLFIAEFGGQKITLLRPSNVTVPPSPPPGPSTDGSGGPTSVTTVKGTSILLDKGVLVMNAVRGQTSGAAKLRITNTSTTNLSITGLAISGGEAGNFQITATQGLPGVLTPGATVTVQVVYKAPAATTLGIHTSSLVITSADASKPSITVPLRGLATAGTGGQNEPSLQRLFDLYQLNINTGDKNAANTDLYNLTESLGASDEVVAQRFVKSVSGPIIIQTLGTFAGGSPAARFGYYTAGSPTSKTEVLTINSTEAQSVTLNPNGPGSFDPGAATFGLYITFPIFGNTAYSEDNLNTGELTAADRRKVRFYPLKNADGTIVPNAYVFTSEDYVNGNGSFDVNDFIGIIRNVKIAAPSVTAEVTYENLDGVPYNDRLVFNRIGVQPPAQLKDPETGLFYQPPNNVVHDTGSLKITNNKSTPITISSLVLSNASAWRITGGPAAGTVLLPGQSVTVTIKFVATAPPTTTVNETIDLTGRSKNANGTYKNTLTITTTDGPKVIELRGYYQLKNEQDQEANLPTIINTIFGFGTQILKPGEALNTGGKRTAVGEEVLSGLWQRVDANQPVTVRQLVAYQSQGDTAKLSWYEKSNMALKGLITHSGVEAQSLLPRTTAGATGANAFNPTGSFGFRVDSEWSEDQLNKQEQPGGNYGHHIRFWPARDRSGNLIPNAYIMGMDYLARNYDFQDNVFLITNVKAANGAGPSPTNPGPVEPPPPTTGPTLAGLTLLDAATDAPLGSFADGAVLDLTGGKQYTVRAEPGPTAIGSVVFSVNGSVVRTENFSPYSIAGEVGSDYTPWSVPTGASTLIATAYSGQNGTGVAGTPIVVNFSTAGTPTVPPPVTFSPVSINFQPAAAPAVAGYTIDAGDIYAARNGLTYGWSASNADAVADREINADQLLDTNVGVKAGTRWELAVPNGTYTVTVGVGDAAATSTNNVWVEGQQLFNYQGLAANVFASKSITVTVNDGKLSIGIGGAATGATHLTHLQVAAPGSPAVPPTSPPPVSPPASPPPATTFGVTTLTLVDATTDQDVATIVDGMTIDFSGGRTYSIRANTAGVTKSAVFKLDGNVVRVESARPFAIAGDIGAVVGTDTADYQPWVVSNGAHTLDVQGFSLANGGGLAGSSVIRSVIVTGL